MKIGADLAKRILGLAMFLCGMGVLIAAYSPVSAASQRNPAQMLGATCIALVGWYLVRH